MPVKFRDDSEADMRLSRSWGIEDSRNGVAGIFVGNIAAARRETLRFCEYTSAPVMLYRITGAGEWIAEEMAKP